MTPTSNSDQTWRPGQRAVINRQRVVVIDKVTPSGRATVGHMAFNPDGFRRGQSRYSADKLELLTPEIEAEMALVQRAGKVSRDAVKAVEGADKWLRTTFSPWRHEVPDPADVARAETLAAAIRDAMEGGQG